MSMADLELDKDSETLASEPGSFIAWESIISDVQDCLPTIDSDSEVSTMTEDSDVDVSVFKRNVTTFAASESDSDKNSTENLPLTIQQNKPVSDHQDISTITSEGYGSATSSSPTSNTSSATSKSLARDEKSLTWHLSGGGSQGPTEASALLFQRLSTRLKDNVHVDEDDLHLTDLDLELPIYEDEKSLSLECPAGAVTSDLSPPPLDMTENRHIPESEPSGQASRTTSESSGLESVSSEGKAPVLSLRGLEGFDLDEILDDVWETNIRHFNVTRETSDQGATGSEDLMGDLIGLSKKQGESLVTADGSISCMQDVQASVEGCGREPGCGEITQGGTMTEKEVSSKPATASCGVTACLPPGELSLSRSETIFLDLRPKENDEDLTAKEVVPKPTADNVERITSKHPRRRSKRFPYGTGHNLLGEEGGEVQQRVMRLTKIRTMMQPTGEASGDSSDSNDDEYAEWQAMRNRIKARSSVTAAVSPNSRGKKDSSSEPEKNFKLNLAPAYPSTQDRDMKHMMSTPEPNHVPDAPEQKGMQSFGEDIPGIEHIDTAESKIPEALLNGYVSPSGEPVKHTAVEVASHESKDPVMSDGLYAKQRLKNNALAKRKPTIKKDGHEKSDKGKITVSFAEEPKKDPEDNTNVYRATSLKNVPKSRSAKDEILSIEEEDVAKSVTSTLSSTSGVQTDDSFPVNPKISDVKLSEIVHNLLGREPKPSVLAGTNKMPVVNDALLNKQAELVKKQFERATSLPLTAKAFDEKRVARETKLKLKVLLEKQQDKRGDGNKLLFDIDASFDDPIPNVPPELNTQKTQMVLLTIYLSSTGCIVTHRSTGNHRGTPVDLNIGFSITYPMLLSWLLALVPEDLNKLHQARMDDTFALEIDPDLVPELTNSGKDSPSIPISVDVPFNVVSLHQAWQEDAQSLVLQAVVVPNFFYKPEIKRGRKKAKKEDAFLQVVWHFLQSNRIQDVCPWHERPESPIHYSLSETIITCATKPLSTYVCASNDPAVIKKALKNKPGLFWKAMTPDDQAPINTAESVCNRLQMTTCLLQREAFMFPVAVMDIAMRLQMSCFDMSGLRLAFVTRRFLNENTLYHSPQGRVDMDEVVPCVVMAIRGRAAVTRWSKIVGPRDPVLARMSERSSLNATYGEQLSLKRGDETLPTDVNMFCYPRSETRALQQMSVWFGGRVDMENKAVARLLGHDSSPVEDTLIKVDKVVMNGKGNSKNGKNKSRNNSSTSLCTLDNGTASSTAQDLMAAPSFIVTSRSTRMFLVVSPRLPTQFISDVLHTITQKGFLVQGVRRFRLNERKAAALSISQRYYPCFCPRVDADMPVDVDYFEDIWWIRPATVILLARENAQAHQAGLIHALQSELMVNLSPPDEEGHVKMITYQCFHTVPYTDAIEHTVGSLTKVPEVELNTGSSPRTFYSNPEMEQVVVLSLIGDVAIDGCGDVLRKLLHGEFQLTNEEISGLTRFPIGMPEEDNDVEYFRGFELLGIKWLPCLTSIQAKELTPFEVGTPAWHESIPHLQSSAVMLCVLRRVNAFQVLEDALNIPRYSFSTSEPISKSDKFSRIMSGTPEIAYRQMKVFFSDKELFPDNQSRPLLKYLPPPTRVHQYRQQRSSVSENGDSVAGGDQHSVSSPSAATSKRSSGKKKKKQNAKNKESNGGTGGHSNGNPISFAFPEESIFTSMVTHQQPLTSILIIKPDAFPRHFVKIFRNLHHEGFTIVAAKVMKMSEDEAFQVVPPFLKDMQGEVQVYLDHMTSGLSFVACLQRDNAIQRLCALAGPHDPRIARSRCYLSQQNGSTGASPSRPTWRAMYGIDNISNGIHVSESYGSACQELKRFFPEGLCCDETLELKMEQVPTPAEDKFMCFDNMKGREVSITPDERQAVNVASSLRVSYMPRKPVVVVLTPPLLRSKNYSRATPNRTKLVKSIMALRDNIPPCVEILDQLMSQGFEICAARMVWFRQNQAEQFLDILHRLKDHDPEISNLIATMTGGPSLLLMMQRENALVLFDSILGSTKSDKSLYHKYSRDILRSQNEEQTKEAARYLFPRIPCSDSVLTISHKKAQEWKEIHTTGSD